MEETTRIVIQALTNAGYAVHFIPGKPNPEGNGRSPGGVSCYIEAESFYLTARIDTKWHGWDATPDMALKRACVLMHDHMRPGYRAYVEMAKVMSWDT